MAGYGTMKTKGPRKDVGPDKKFGRKGEKNVGVMRRGRAALADAAFKNQGGPTDLLRRATRATKRALGVSQSGQGTKAKPQSTTNTMRSPRDPTPNKVNAQISSGRTGTAPAAATTINPSANKTGGSTGATMPKMQSKTGTGTFVEGRPPILPAATNKANASPGSRKMPAMSSAGKNSGPGKGTVAGAKTGAQSTAPSVGKTMNTPAMGGRVGGGGGSRSTAPYDLRRTTVPADRLARANAMARADSMPMRDTSPAAKAATMAARATLMSGKSK